MKTLGEIIFIKVETPDVKTFRVKTHDLLDFISGQYGLVSLLDAGELKGEQRPLTFSNNPVDKGFIEFTVKKMGKFTSAMHCLKVGDHIEIQGPLGEALMFDETVKDPVVFIAGGSGITPFMSALRYVEKKNLSNEIILINSNRTEADIVFRDEIEYIDMCLAQIRTINTLTDESPKNWRGEHGRISKDMILKYVKTPEMCVWYVCGPPPMIDAVRKILKGLNVPDNKIRFEDWQLPGKHD